MSTKSNTIDLGGGSYLTTGPTCTGIHFAEGDENHFDREMLGHIAEWLAVAWENVAGEEYKPVVISERGYVSDKGVVHAGGHAIPKAEISDEAFNLGMDALEAFAKIAYKKDTLERDCE